MKLKVVIRKTGEDEAVVALEGEVTIYTVQKLREAFLARMKGTCDLKLDLSRVSKIDTAGYQFLLAVKREYLSAGGCVSYADAGGEVQRILDLYGTAIC